MDFYESIFTNPITVTIDVGYGEVNGTAITGNILGLTKPILENQKGALLGYLYSEIYNALAGDSVPASELPASDPSGGQVFTIADSEAKALGLDTSTGGVDAYVGFSSSLPFDYSLTNGAAAGQYDFISVVEHEFSHALGRITHSVAGYQYMSVLDLYRYTSAGILAPYASSSSYFSLNRGVTDIENFGAELSSWATFGSGYDAYNSQIYMGGQYNVAAQDIELMDALGYTTPSVVVGTGTNFGGYGEQDEFLRTTTGQLVNWQYDASGALVGGIALTDQGSPLIIDATTTVVGAGGDFFENGGHAVFLRNAVGALMVREFDANGSETAGQTLMRGGSPATIDAGASVVGVGQNFWGTGGYDIFVRSGSGQLSADEFDANGNAVAGLAFSGWGSPLTVGVGTTAIGGGTDFWQNGGHTVFLRSASGQLSADELDANGNAVAGLAFNGWGSPLTVGVGTTAIGGGADFWQNGGRTVFLRSASGQLSADEFDANGNATAGVAFTDQGLPVTIDAAMTVVGAAQNFAGTDGHDVFLLTGSGTVEYVEFNANGAANTRVMTFVYAANNTAVDVGALTSVVGSGASVLGQHEQDIFLREATGQVHIWDIVNNNVMQLDLDLTFGNGDPATIPSGDLVSGTGQNLLGRGGHDIMIRAATGQTYIWEFNANGVLLAAK